MQDPTIWLICATQAMATADAPPLTADYRSKAFDETSVGKHRLVLSLASHTVQFAVLSDLFEVLLYREYHSDASASLRAQLDRIAYADPLLQHRYGHVDVLLQSPQWMLVPAMHAPNGSELEYLRTQHELEATDLPLRDNIRTVGGTVLYAAPEDAVTRAQQLFHKVNLRHQVSPMLVEAQRLHYAIRSPYSMGVLVLEQSVQVFVTGLFGLLLANEYAVTTASAVADKLNLALQATALPASETRVYVVGRGTLRKELEASLPGRFPQYTSVKAFFAGQPGLNQAGHFHDEFPHLLQRMS